MASAEALESEGMVPTGLLPKFLSEIFGEVYSEDGLVVVGKGLQPDLLLATLIRYYGDLHEGHWAQDDSHVGQSRSDGKQRRPLVIVLGLYNEVERSTVIDALTSWGTPPHQLPQVLTNEAGQAKERSTLYNQGGVIIITSRILIVDLLNNTLPSTAIDGILVANAHKVTETSTEAFCLRIIQSQRQFASHDPAFVKAISDEPEKIVSGFAKPDKILKALHVRRLYLYPRFHDIIREELEVENAPEVTEYHQQLSPLQKEMQQAIAAAIKSCVRELKTTTPLLDLTATELGGANDPWSVESIVTNQMDRVIMRNLEHDWHRLSPKAKQLVQDVRTLRTLFSNLLTFDCVSFYKLLQSLKSLSAASRHPSLWLLTPAADALFRKAKERVYSLIHPKPTAEIPNPVSQCQTLLEENPKWRLLQQVLLEIKSEFHKQTSNQDLGHGPTQILILVKDERTLEAVKDFLINGKRTLLLRWLRYLEQYNDRSRSTAAVLSEESRILLEEESRVRRILFSATSGGAIKRDRGLPPYKANKKRRRVAVEKNRGEVTHQADDLEREAILDEAVYAAEVSQMNIFGSSGNENPAVYRQFDVTFPNELRIGFKSYTSVSGDQATLLLQDIRPRHVIFYDTEVAFVRAVEIQAATSMDKIKVHFLMFEASVEESMFLKSLEREKNAFERLIHHKQTMPPPVLHSSNMTQEMQQALTTRGVDGTYMNGSLPLSLDTRRGRGKANTSKDRRDIAVDVREFRSALPSILHQGGMRLAPVTLTVGDFILSNVHCVERKSVSDLFGSFASGRLYTQVEAMVKHYKVPCLLIEFDPAKSFSLQNASELGSEIRTDSICSKIALLTMHFPQLRILWSRTPHETLRIFRELKKNHDEVDVDKAIEVGRNESEEVLLSGGNRDGEDDDDDEINETARDMLLRLPGMNVTAARRIMEHCNSLAELSQMSRDDLRSLAGPAIGQKLFTFFRQRVID